MKSVHECRKEAVLKQKSLQAFSVKEQLMRQANKSRAENRELLLKQLSSPQFLLRQGLAIHGHKETERSLMQWLELRSEDVHSLTSWLQKQRYPSHQIVNEMISLMGNTLPVPATEISVYQQDIDAHKLELQLQMLPDLVKVSENLRI